MTPEMMVHLKNDGLNIAVAGGRLYVRCMRSMFSYDTVNMTETAHEVVFKKDGKARGFSLFGDFVYLTDFCDLYILAKDRLQVLDVYRLGGDLTSDLGAVRFDATNAYIGVRNGKMAVMDMCTHDACMYSVTDSSFWDFCVLGNCIYAGTVHGELVAIDTEDMQVVKKASLGKKNIYSVVPYGKFLYAVSQDMTIKAIDIDTLEVAFQAKKAVGGMARILGVDGERLLIADSNKVSVWDVHTLGHQDTIAFPTGSYNKGIVLSGGILYGSDLQGIYRMMLV